MNFYQGQGIVAGQAEGVALLSEQPLALSLINPSTGVVEQHGHALRGVSVSGAILIYPTGRGSSSGSYKLFHMAHSGTAPLAIINVRSDAITAAGAVLGRIPLVHRLNVDPLSKFHTGDVLRVDGVNGMVWLLGRTGAPECA